MVDANSGKDEIKCCALGGMLGALAEMQKSDKWGLILDTNGNVGTFMKYKASHYDAFSACGNNVWTIED